MNERPCEPRSDWEGAFCGCGQWRLTDKEQRERGIYASSESHTAMNYIWHLLDVQKRDREEIKSANNG